MSMSVHSVRSRCYLNKFSFLEIVYIFNCRNYVRIFRGVYKLKKTKLHGLSPRANYTDRATAACRRSDCQLLRIEGATWSA
jgi:hypothetical protein